MVDNLKIRVKTIKNGDTEEQYQNDRENCLFGITPEKYGSENKINIGYFDERLRNKPTFHKE